MTESDQTDVKGAPNRSRTILLNARKGAIRAGIGVFVVMLILSLVVRGSQFRMLGWDALWMLLRMDLLIALRIASLGALVGGVTGAILALQGASLKSNNEPQKHPLD